MSLPPIGHDTEYFLLKADNTPIPAHLAGISKEKQKSSSCWSSNYQRDGYALELGTQRGSLCRASLWENQFTLLQDLFDSAGLLGKQQFKLSNDPWMEVDLDELNTAPADVRRFGCSPSYDPYTQSTTEVGANPLKTPFRTIGAHLHIQIPDGLGGNLDKLGLVAQYADLLIGLPFTVIFNDDLEFKRRELYGRAGEFRPQEYENSNGFEYRVLSPRLYNHPALFSLFTGIWKYAIWPILHHSLDNTLAWNNKLDEPLQRAINTGEGAETLLDEFNKTMQTYAKKPEEGKEDRSEEPDFAYTPKHWGDALSKLKEMAEEGVFKEFMLPKVESGHYGWYEYNTGKDRWSTTYRKHRKVEKAWQL